MKILGYLWLDVAMMARGRLSLLEDVVAEEVDLL